MEHQVFSVYDSKARAFIPPFFVNNADVAIRVFAECANSKTHQFGKYAEDFTLFHIGTFDDEKGVIHPFQVHKNLGLAATYKTRGVIVGGVIVEQLGENENEKAA